MKYAWLLALATTGCFATRSQEFTCSTTTDCSGDRVCDQGFCVLGAREPDASTTNCTMITSPHVMFCTLPDPGTALDLTTPGTYTYDTDAATLVDPSGATVGPPPHKLDGEIQIISIQSLSVHAGATLRAIGSHPLLVASWSTITVDGTVDAGSRAPTTTSTDLHLLTGAGSNPSGCSVATAGKDSNGGGAGGGGGGFGGTGGNGGRGNNDGNSPGIGGVAQAAPTSVVAGCSGGKGGTGTNAEPGGSGGAGGGAIQLVAATSISISGTVEAGGAGGAPASRLAGNSNDGGGGGGSGGLVGLDAPTITITATAILAANGGGGGAGTNGMTPGPTAGGDGSASASAAAGGTTVSTGKGGPGSASTVLIGSVGLDSSAAGGGGGGGGAGFVILHGTAVTAGSTLSPPMTAM